ncbi:MAG: hypothetical protein JW795_22365, partial [Chitinivibrionales bacterium]|nr:hypothetical protein [Chitinivibrionales bacterium]
ITVFIVLTVCRCSIPGLVSMKKIAVDHIEQGMILAQEVYGSTGSALLGKGTQLSPSLGRRLKSWGVSFVYVDGEEESKQEIGNVPISTEEIRQKLQEKFSAVLKNPLMAQLFDAVYEYKSKKTV